MSGIPIVDRLALEDLLTTYCAAIDARGDAEATANFFTLDGVLDNTALGSPPVEGRAALAETIVGMFTAMAVLEHYLSNFLVLEIAGDTASTQAYVQAHGTPVGGAAFAMRGVYLMTARRQAGAWKIARLTFKPHG